MARKKKTEELEPLNGKEPVRFEEFKSRCERRFAGLKQFYGDEAKDLRIYNDLPFNENKSIFPYDSAPAQYWMMFQWEEDHYLIISCDPRTGSANYYTDYHYVIDGRTYGFFSKVAPHYSWEMALCEIEIYLRTLRNFRTMIVRRQLLVMDSNFTNAWKNGDTPLTSEWNECSLITLIDDITEAKKDPDPAWKGMCIKVCLHNDLTALCDYAVKF